MPEPLHITFVCSGNICRSPMAQNIFRTAVRNAGLGDQVRVDSCAIGPWHVGDPADERARAELLRAGYPDQHTAAQLGPEHDDADLFVAMDSGHLAALQRKRVGDRAMLLRGFDPDADDLEVADPYYGSPDDFVTVREQIESAVPGLLAWVRDRLPSEVR
ncbi:low molecular weight protein-tyrosine-phosphatase [Williamsia sterculiae]|uniref:protein-tyrosine-phosphatase n=1 Tax=Williamsia sterculiae TaxID=1344003 RepID=A0A1N7G9F9_9NOCA|nr:low molecular weight protein-tyrosine-phosphatase [Williamsia sterculiae]SIS09116.1 protein-tyrosine phosphatase [Williamsia sterculiae]